MLLTLCSASLYAQRPAEQIAKLRQEIAALQELKSQKLDKLERSEAERWNARYAHRQEIELLQSRERQLESQYTAVATLLNRAKEDMVLVTSALQEEQRLRDEARQTFSAFIVQIQQSLSQTAQQLHNDIPWNLAPRTALLSALQQQLEQSSAQVGDVMSRYLDERLNRVKMTQLQELTTRAALFGDGIERTVWTLQLGSIALIDIAKDSAALQSLLRSGALEGPRFAWRTQLGEQYEQAAQALIVALQQGAQALVPLDILQNGSLGVSSAQQPQQSLLQTFISWFKAGGLIMYPLALAALGALLLALERFITLTLRHHSYTKNYRRLMPLINAGDFDNAALYCKDGCTGLTRAIQEIVKQRHGSRINAEQHVKQILLAEVPSLEKRMSLINSLGASAPLLGLLGTVSGMITLFRVITEAGTNDARILAGGISEALITTQAGLVIAIPVLLIHGYLMERLDDILSHYNETVLEVFNTVFNKDGAGK
jgi:biopolymer transport protein ExbB